MKFLKNAVFRDVTPCGLEKFANVSKEPATLVFNSEDRVGRFLVNVFKFLPLDGFMPQNILLLLLFSVTVVITPNFTLEAPRNSATAAAPPPLPPKCSPPPPVPVHPHALCSSQRERPNLTSIHNTSVGTHGGAVG
jgi:hypothetical protein